MNQSESFIEVLPPWYDCQSNINIEFLNYSGNIYCGRRYFQFAITYTWFSLLF